MTSSVTCEAYDPDGDMLNFEWGVNEGTISGAGKVVIWLIPAKPGRYVIEVTVNDGKGGRSVGSIVNNVTSVKITDGICHTVGSMNIKPRDKDGAIGYNYSDTVTRK
jgi:hypothetical protein